MRAARSPQATGESDRPTDICLGDRKGLLEQLIGLASIGDLVKATLDEKDFEIRQLTKYIKGE